MTDCTYNKVSVPTDGTRKWTTGTPRCPLPRRPMQKGGVKLDFPDSNFHVEHSKGRFWPYFCRQNRDLTAIFPWRGVVRGTSGGGLLLAKGRSDQSRSVIEGLGRDIEMSRPADRIESNECLREEYRVVELPERTFVQIGTCVEDPRLAMVELELELKSVKDANAGDCLH